jgi:hypothetical protein
LPAGSKIFSPIVESLILKPICSNGCQQIGFSGYLWDRQMILELTSAMVASWWRNFQAIFC